MIFLIFLSSLVYQTFAVCKYLYDSNIPVPLDYCQYNTPLYSYGFYCVPNYNNTPGITVLEVYFDAPNCPNGYAGTWSLYKTYNCTELGANCRCDGNIDECTLGKKIRSDYSYVTGCNQTLYKEEVNVYDVCIGVGSFGGRYIGCNDNDGVSAQWYYNANCTGSLKPTPAPVTPSPLIEECKLICCDPDDCPLFAPVKDEKGTTSILIVIIVVVVVVICCILLVVVIVCWRRKRARTVQYFDDEVVAKKKPTKKGKSTNIDGTETTGRHEEDDIL